MKKFKNITVVLALLGVLVILCGFAVVASAEGFFAQKTERFYIDNMVGHEVYQEYYMRKDVDVTNSGALWWRSAEATVDGTVQWGKYASNNPSGNYKYDSIEVKDVLMFSGTGITLSGSVSVGTGTSVGVGVNPVVTANELTFNYYLENATSIRIVYDDVEVSMSGNVDDVFNTTYVTYQEGNAFTTKSYSADFVEKVV